MLPLWVLACAFGVALAAGLLIGSVGVGGVIIVPIMITVTDEVDVQTAIASAMASYMAAGASGALMYARKHSIEWSTAYPFLCGTAPTAFAASFSLQFVGDDAVKAALYGFMLATSALTAVKTLRRRRAPPRDGGVFSGAAAGAEAGKVSVGEARGAGLGGDAWSVLARCCLGGITGFGSAATGTGGPLCSLPMFTALEWPITTALGCAQVAQVPIALASTLAYVALRPGTIDWPLAGALALGLTPAVAAGAVLAHRAPAALLKTAVAGVLVVASLLALASLALASL